MSHWPRLITYLTALLLLIDCAGSPTAPPTCRTVLIFGQESFYTARTEHEQDFRGSLEFRNVLPTPNGRDHRYFVADVPVYSGGSIAEALFAETAGNDVTIHGKLVDVGYGPEIWAATLSSCR
jgi:hypothetical protein